ncbi:DUF2591 family protein [Klebsiella pneumoniae]|nr:DUF2591 family protein [Klebsiella pneumoniae]
MDYSKMSDLEININIAELLHPGKKFTAAYSFFQPEGPAVQWICGYAEYIKADYCNNPADAWPIITSNRIGIVPGTATDKWAAHHVDWDIAIADVNPLRAAMIIFLMMQDSRKSPS